MTITETPPQSRATVPGARRGRTRSTANPAVQTTTDEPSLQVTGILSVQEGHAFIRTTGYLPGPTDVYVSPAQIRKYELRPGDELRATARPGKGGRDKFPGLVEVESVNGLAPGFERPEFGSLTPLHPNERLVMGTDPTTRIIDLVAPVGKGQRGLIVSPPKAGKTMVVKALANAVIQYNPEAHLMVVLVDERPEEVTDMQRAVLALGGGGEVIHSTFDRSPSDHIAVAELAVERAKRQVELGHDVVILLDSITRLGRAYNLAAPSSSRILTGGVSTHALHPPKRFLGAARNIENGGSLTILASALVETGSMMDTVLFEEFKGTGNMELKLDRHLADKRLFPAIDVEASGTRREDLLMSPEELRLRWQLRRVLHALDDQQALETLLGKVKETRSNAEFLMQVQRTTPRSEVY